ncbi:hypothetical protein NQD34_007857 [Periophthalmus magnuspinnatus]|nr:hypothetical protein NQD34_007857 [Periophthalmus magnuspinnatus]
MLDAGVVNMIKDSRPFSIMEDEGFVELMKIVDPNYILPNRKALKEMIEKKYNEAKEKSKEQLQKASALSLTSDMWTSINMEAYLAVTCHFFHDDQLCSTLLGVKHFPQSHTAENFAEGHINLMEEWGIREITKFLITDGASNMIAMAKRLNVRHTVCVADAINLMVKKSLDDAAGMNELRTKCRKVATYFRTSTTAKEQLFQLQMGGQPLKMIIEVDTHWKSTFLMFKHAYELKESVSAALTTVNTDVAPLTASDYDITKEALVILGPFYEATVELSSEKKVSSSKVIPLMAMVHHAVVNRSSELTNIIAKNLAESLTKRAYFSYGNSKYVNIANSLGS